MKAKRQRLSLQRDLESLHDSLDRWDDVNFNSIQVVYVDDSTGTSISSASRVTETAISHPPQAGRWPRAVSTNRTFSAESGTNIKAARRLVCSSEYVTNEHVPNSSDRLKLQFLQSQSPVMEDPKREREKGPEERERETEQIAVNKWPQPTQFRS